jgi:hypothetical protein
MIANLFISAAARAAPVPKEPGALPRISPGCRSGSNVSPRETEALLGLFRNHFCRRFDRGSPLHPCARARRMAVISVTDEGARACQKQSST